jgi:hypothetical protein
MEKKASGRLSAEERDPLRGGRKKLQGSSQPGRRAPMRLKADAHGPHWTETKMAEACSWRTHTGAPVRQRLVTVGFASARDGEQPPTPPRPPRLEGAPAAQGLAVRLGQPPPGGATWAGRLWAAQVVALALVDAVRHATLRNMLKKPVCRRLSCRTGAALRQPTARVARPWQTA